MNKKERKIIYEEAIKKFGTDIQFIIAIEEMSELTKELTKMIRGYDRGNGLVEEIGDVRIMLEIIEIILNCENEVIESIDFKLNNPVTREKIIVGRKKRESWKINDRF